MTWIRTVSLAEADEKLKKAIDGEREFYPKEYAEPVHPDPSGASSIVGSHTLIRKLCITPSQPSDRSCPPSCR